MLGTQVLQEGSGEHLTKKKLNAAVEKYLNYVPRLRIKLHIALHNTRNYAQLISCHDIVLLNEASAEPILPVQTTQVA